MSLFVSQLSTHARIQFLRHIRSPAIWGLAIATPIAARFMVPKPGGSYSVMAVNDANLALDSGVMGLQLGVVMAIILTPLAYIFLRAGPTRQQPWQAEDTTPARRSAQALGHWLADTAALWILMGVLVLAGIILSVFRLPLDEIRPFDTVLALTLIAAPALAVIAGVRTIFSMRPWLRKAGGDVAFFFIWLALILSSIAYFGFEGEVSSAYFDVLGLAAPLAAATDYPIDALLIVGSSSATQTLPIDAIGGVTNTEFLLSRVFWIVVTAALVFVSGLLFKPRKIGAFTPLATASGPVEFTQVPVAPVVPSLTVWMTKSVSEALQMLSPRWVAGLLAMIALAGFVLPLRGLIGPALALVLIFPLTRHGARWRDKHMAKLTALSPTERVTQVFIRVGTAIALSLTLCVPAFLRIVTTGETAEFADIIAIGLCLPIIAIGLGHVTRGAVAGRLILLILWYGYLNA